MKIKLVSPGKTKEAYLEAGIRDFHQRLIRYTAAELVFPKLKKCSGLSIDEAIAHEGEQLRNRAVGCDYLVVLDRTGTQMNSEQLAGYIDSWEMRGIKQICFIIGGPLGIAGSLAAEADLIWSLSELTFTHELARLLLLEQLYRAYTIKAGERYHK